MFDSRRGPTTRKITTPDKTSVESKTKGSVDDINRFGEDPPSRILASVVDLPRVSRRGNKMLDGPERTVVFFNRAERWGAETVSFLADRRPHRSQGRIRRD